MSSRKCVVCGGEKHRRGSKYCAKCSGSEHKQNPKEYKNAILAICKDDCFNCPFPDCRINGSTPSTRHIDLYINRLNRGETKNAASGSTSSESGKSNK